MKVLEQRAIPGPNHYSPYPTVFMRLDLEEHAATPSNAVPGFNERLLELLPTLREHRCSRGHVGGFAERLAEGTYMGHVVEHVAIELQCMAGLKVGFGKTRETHEPGVYTVVYRYRTEEAGLEAGLAAVDLVTAVLQGVPFDVKAVTEHLEALHRRQSLGPSTNTIVGEARRRGIPVLRLNASSYLQLGHGARQQRIQASLTGNTSCIGCEIADDKDRTKAILEEAGVPVPRGELVHSLEGALEAADELGYPVVVKPRVGNHGRGVSTGLRTPAELAIGFAAAREVDAAVLVEQHLEGADFRVLVVGHRFIAAARRDPAQVVGDGRRTVAQLVEEANADPRRADGHESWLTRIEIDAESHRQLNRQGMGLESVPAAGQAVILKGTANLSTGGTATDVTNEVHPLVRRMAERVSRMVGLDIMGLDIVAPTLARPLAETRGGVVEVNAAPGLRMHAQPTVGRPRNVGSPIVDMLFPNGADGRIPIVAITGTNGKTTTVRLVSHILAAAGGRVGIATTTGVEIDGEPALEGDYSGPDGARAVLTDPLVDHAVLEVARGGILRRGLGYDRADVGVFLNVASDHLGEGGIETLQDLAELKAVVVENVARSGTAVLNADDPAVARYADTLRCRTILFGLDPAGRELTEHVARSGTAVTVVGTEIVLRDRNGDETVGDVRDYPVTMGGVASFNVQNAMAAVAACRALGVPVATIDAALRGFTPSPSALPGRMNLLEVGPVQVLVDYGHNAPALAALQGVVDGLRRGGRVIAAANASGNRRDEDILAFGAKLATMYDHILLSDPDPRRRAPGETMAVLRQGILDTGFDAARLETADSERVAIERALALAQPGDLVVLQLDDVRAGLELVQEHAARAAGHPADRPAARPRPLRRAGQEDDAAVKVAERKRP
ncbi:MAG: cyanophycin synthetase [Thermoplasmata archaeon]|jgi:cyanophycin synthetase|nr:cyanophycin synthetase [Thermoplasmata archaeon]